LLINILRGLPKKNIGCTEALEKLMDLSPEIIGYREYDLLNSRINRCIIELATLIGSFSLFFFLNEKGTKIKVRVYRLPDGSEVHELTNRFFYNFVRKYSKR
jgi:hypothetical protein